jgi:hypothetical protein
MAGRLGPSWVGSVVPLVLSHKVMRNRCGGLLLEISWFRWVAPLQPGVVGHLYGTGCMAPRRLPSEGVDRIHIHMP